MATKNVLIVHNDLIISYLLKKIIELPDILCYMANNYTDVQQSISSNTFDIIITDITIDGIFVSEYIDYLKHKFSKTSILILTEMHQNNIRKEVQSLGVEEFIDLPITVNDLKQKLAKHI